MIPNPCPSLKTKTINQQETKNSKNIKLLTNGIVLPRFTYTEPRAKRGRLAVQT